MAIKLGNNADLLGAQLLNVRAQNLAGFSSGLGTSHKGRFEFDTVQNAFGVWSGSAWVKLRDDWVSSVAGAAGSPISASGSGAITLDIALASGQFLVGNGSNLARATAKSSIPLSGFGQALADVSMGTNRITSLASPVNADDAATKAYVDSQSQGLDVKGSCKAATTSALPSHTRSGNVLTASANGAFPALDGVSLSVGDRVLVKDEGGGTHLENGIYTLTAAGGASAQWELTRATDADTSGKVTAGLYTWVTQGTANGDSGWYLTTDDPITLNTTNLTFVQFSGAAQILADRGLVKSGNSLFFAQTGAYTANTIPYATGASTIGFIALNATATPMFLKQASSGAPGFAQIGIADISGNPVSGTGSTGTIPKWSGTGSLTDSVLTQTGSAISVNGTLGVNVAAPAGLIHTSKDGNENLILVDSYSSTQTWHSSKLIMRRIRGTSASPSSVASGDDLGAVQWYGRTTNGFTQLAGALLAVVDGTPGTDHVPTAFHLFLNNGSGIQDRLSIGADGKVYVGSLAGTETRLLAVNADSSLAAVPNGTGGQWDFPAGTTIGSKVICRKVTAAITSGTTSLAITHGLNTTDLTVMVRNASGEYMIPDYTANSTSQVTLAFSPATTEALTAVILG